MDYNRMRRLLPVAPEQQTTNEQHPKNRAIQISFDELLILLKSGVWQIYKFRRHCMYFSHLFFLFLSSLSLGDGEVVEVTGIIRCKESCTYILDYFWN